MELSEFQIQGLADAIAAWCDFQVHCGRETLLSERYMAQPIAEYLGSYFGSRSVLAEWSFGVQQQGVGRPRQHDFVLKRPDRQRPSVAIETKWVNNFDQRQKKGAVLDIMRLVAFPWENGHHLNQQPQRLFILAGRKEAMKQARSSRINVGDGPRAPFLSAVLSNELDEEATVTIGNLSHRLQAMFQEFEDEYDTELPVGYRANLLGRRSLKTVQVMIWAVGRA